MNKRKRVTPKKITRVFVQLTSRNYSPLVQIYDSRYGCQSFDSGQEVYLNYLKTGDDILRRSANSQVSLCIELEKL